MNSKEKAKELVSIFGKELAVKVVGEILNSLDDIESGYRPYHLIKFWQEVKTEIEKL